MTPSVAVAVSKNRHVSASVNQKGWTGYQMAYLVYGQTLGCGQAFCALDDVLLGPMARPAKPLLLQHGDDLATYRWVMAVLMICRVAAVTENDAVVPRIGSAVADSALCCEDGLCRSSSFDGLGGFG